MGSSPEISAKVIHAIVRMVMVPFVRLLLRYGVAHSDFSAITRRLYVEVAERDFQLTERNQSVARVAVLTGLTRREVKRILDEPDPDAIPIEFNRAGRVVEAWMRDRTFWGDNGQPAALSITSKSRSSFHALVKKYGGDIPARAVMDELISRGAIRKEGETVLMTSTGYVPAGDSEEMLTVTFRSVGHLISTIDHNDQNGSDQPRLQLTVEYDNVSSEGADSFRILSREKSKEMLVYLDRFLATQDRDINPAITGDGQVRTGLGIFFFQDDNDNTRDSQK